MCTQEDIDDIICNFKTVFEKNCASESKTCATTNKFDVCGKTFENHLCDVFRTLLARCRYDSVRENKKSRI